MNRILQVFGFLLNLYCLSLNTKGSCCKINIFGEWVEAVIKKGKTKRWSICADVSNLFFMIEFFALLCSTCYIKL